MFLIPSWTTANLFKLFLNLPQSPLLFYFLSFIYKTITLIIYFGTLEHKTWLIHLFLFQLFYLMLCNTKLKWKLFNKLCLTEKWSCLILEILIFYCNNLLDFRFIFISLSCFPTFETEISSIISEINFLCSF